MELKDVAADYFSRINSMANRMSVDMKETRAAYEGLWLTLREDEKIQILNESIIKPEICLKYTESPKNDKNKNEYAVKIIVDDNYSFRDEHSAPFSFRTASQRNLCLFSKQPENSKKAVYSSSKSKDKLKIAPQRPVCGKSKVASPSSLIEFEVEDEVSASSGKLLIVPQIPKTGLDLLDNW